MLANRRRRVTARKPREALGPALYFIQRGPNGPIKIGISSTVDRRLADLQTGCAESLMLLAAIDGLDCLEPVLHRHFAASRLSGEWFRPTLSLYQMIDELYLDAETWRKFVNIRWLVGAGITLKECRMTQ